MKKLLLFLIAALFAVMSAWAQLTDIETFSSPISLSPTQVADAWYPDRYPPAAFESYPVGTENKLRIGIDLNDGAQLRQGSYSGAFYNTQGRKFDLSTSTTSLYGSLYIPADWATKHRRSDMWATAFDNTNSVVRYPIIGFANVDGLTPVLRYWTESGWINITSNINYNSWNNFAIIFDGASFKFYVNSVLVASDSDIGGTTYFGNVIMQAYNFNDNTLGTAYDNSSDATYDAYWDNIGIPSDGPITYAGKIVASTSAVTVPITVKNFKYVDAISLSLLFNTSVLSYTGFIENEDLSEISDMDANIIDNKIIFTWIGNLGTGVSLPDDAVLINVNFTVIGGTSLLTWYDNDEISCEYQNALIQFPYDDDLSSEHYINGWVTDMSVTFTRAYTPSQTITAVVAGGDDPYTYSWTGPVSQTATGATITPTDGYGNYTVTITDELGAVLVGTYYYGPVHNIDTYFDYATIQGAINATITSNGHTLVADAGTYAENITVNKSLDIRGPNFGLAGNSGSRVAEAIVVPGTSSASGEIFMVQTSNVSIDGFTIDGDNPLLTSGNLGTNGADLDAAEAVTVYVNNVNNLTVSHNIIQNLTYFGVTIFGASYSAPTTSGHLVSANLIKDMGHYNSSFDNYSWGGGVLIYNGQYTRIVDNVMTNVRIGIQTGNFQTAHIGDPQFQVIENNMIQTRYIGIFFNLHNYSPFTVSNNIITGLDNATQASITTRPWRGMLIASLGNNMGSSTFSNNSIDGSGITLFTTGKEGINVWNVQNNASANISGGSINGVITGIFLNNFEGYSSDAGYGAYATIDGVSINASGIGIRLLDSPSSATHANIQATITNCFITGGTDGVKLEEVSSGKVTGIVNENSITGNSGYSINATTVANNVAATCNWYGTNTVAGVVAEINGPVTYIPWLIDGDDSGDPGFVPDGPCTGATELFVNNNATGDGDIYTTAVGLDSNPGTATAPFLTITKAVNTAVNGSKIWVDAGTFQEQVLIGKTVDITGVDRTKTIVKAPVTLIPQPWHNGNANPIVYAYGNANTVNISKIAIDGDGGRTISNYVGMLYFEANGTFTDNKITAIRDAGNFSGAQAGIGFYAGHIRTATLAQNITFTYNIVDDFQKGGVVVNAPGTFGIIDNNVITGQNVALVTAQNGIQLSRGAYGSVQGNTVSNCIWNKIEHPHQWTAAGILLYQAGTTTVSGNTLNGNEVGLSSSASVGITYGINTFNNNKIHLWLDAAGDVNAGNIYDKKVLNPAIPEAVFGCIQYAIDEAAPLAILNASAGTFVENVNVHTTVTLNGPNAGNDPTLAVPARVAEAIVMPAVNDPVNGRVFDVTAANVTINGFTVDGDNPGLTGGVPHNGADINTQFGIGSGTWATGTGGKSGMQIKYNIVQNCNDGGIYGNGGGTPVEGGLFTYNWVDNSPWWGIVMENNCYTDITYNKITRVSRGVQYDNYWVAKSSGNSVVEYNNVTYTKRGILQNLFYSNGSLFQIRNNTLNASTSPEAANVGLMYWSIASGITATAYNNTINANIDGVRIWNCQGNVTVDANIVNGGQYGVHVTTLDAYGLGSVSDALITRNTINNPSSAGLYLEDTDAGVNSIDITATYNFFNGAADGGLASGGEITAAVNSNSITGQSSLGVNGTAYTGVAPLDFTCNWWGTADGDLIAPMISGNVSYVPWLVNGFDNSADPGFQPVPGTCSGAPYLTGTYKYYNSGLTVMNNVTVELWKGSKVYGPVTTDGRKLFIHQCSS